MISFLLKHDAGAERVYQDGERRKPIRVAVLQQRTKHGGRKIGAAAYRLGKDYVGGIRPEFADGVDQLRKPAAKTTAGNLSGLHPGQRRIAAVDQILALIVPYH